MNAAAFQSPLRFRLLKVLYIFLGLILHPSNGFTPRAIKNRSVELGYSNQYETRHKDEDSIESSDAPASEARRWALQSLVAAGTFIPMSALAARPEFDATTGQLYSPKGEMLSGGSEATRGIRREGFQQKQRLQPGEALQDVYSTRFLAYLTRFLLTYDQAAHAWWIKQGYADTWDTPVSQASSKEESQRRAKFAEFAESVEIGLADYFVGPYGSYASVTAAKAGLNAAAPATSLRPPKRSFFGGVTKFSLQKAAGGAISTEERTSMSRQGVLNLYALLKARYTSVSSKRQLAILFSLISSKRLQPTAEIRSLLGEADNATVTELEVIRPPADTVELNSRTSCRRGGGYSIYEPPRVIIEPPPALGDEFKQAEGRAVLKPTSRILSIRVTDPGAGYTSAPIVTIKQGGTRKQCEACAILDRLGHVESVIVLDPGFGYGGGRGGDIEPTVQISAPKASNKRKQKGDKGVVFRTAKAVAELEYEIAGLELVIGGNGYVASEPPSVYVTPPKDDPDWYVSTGEVFEKAGRVPFEREFLKAKVFAMSYGNGRPVTELFSTVVDNSLIQRLQRDPLELIPSSVRPRLVPDESVYQIQGLPPVPVDVKLPSPQYRAYDPIFGGVGTVPIQKSARALKADEYWRLALSGAVCTVLVRTLLNPLELVKTKLQLVGVDTEVDQVAYEIMQERLKDEKGRKGKVHKRRLESARQKEAVAPVLSSELSDGPTATLTIPDRTFSVTDQDTTASIGTIDMIKAIVKLRGPLALFQSSDITFLASLVFGSLGFGATELFRRSFTSAFYSETSGETGSEIILLVAAAVACVVTSFVATPFETLRVKSMSLVESKSWTEVLQDFLNDQRGDDPVTAGSGDDGVASPVDQGGGLALKDLKPKDVAPLFSRFYPIVYRELPFAVTKFLVFDLISLTFTSFLNSVAADGAMPVQVGVGSTGLAISALSGALAGIAGAVISHPADLILTLTSTKAKQETHGENPEAEEEDEKNASDWRPVVQELLSKDGGIVNLFVGLPARASFFFLVIGLQFFLYDWVKGLFQVSSDDLSLVLDVFYAIRQGLVGINPEF